MIKHDKLYNKRLPLFVKPSQSLKNNLNRINSHTLEQNRLNYIPQPLLYLFFVSLVIDYVILIVIFWNTIICHLRIVGI